MIMRDLLDLAGKEKRRKERVKAVQKCAIGMGIVVTVGVATGILFAPKSGKETRENMKNKAVNTVETIKDTVKNKAKAVKNKAETVKNKAETVKDSTAQAAKEM